MSFLKKIKPCSACGTHPVRHGLAFTASAIEVFVKPLEGFFFGWIGYRQCGPMVNLVTKIGFTGARFVGLARTHTDIEQARSGRSKLIWQEARERGILMEQISLFGILLDHYRARIAGRWVHFDSLPIPPWLPQKGYMWIDDKHRLVKYLSRHGLAAPRSKHALTLFAALRAFRALTKPVIVKPRFGSLGRHTTTNINTEDELRQAYDLVKKISAECVIEEHLKGSIYRGTVVGGRLAGFFRADRPSIVGNGVDTVALLIEKKPEIPRVSPVTITPDLISFIGRQGYTVESILTAGETLELSAKTGRLYGSYTKEMLSDVHPALKVVLEKAAALLKVPIVGFDLIIPDPTEDPSPQRWGIIEANSLPFIDLHFFALEGEPNNLAKNIWDLWENRPKRFWDRLLHSV